MDQCQLFWRDQEIEIIVIGSAVDTNGITHCPCICIKFSIASFPSKWNTGCEIQKWVGIGSRLMDGTNMREIYVKTIWNIMLNIISPHWHCSKVFMFLLSIHHIFLRDFWETPLSSACKFLLDSLDAWMFNGHNESGTILHGNMTID